MGKLQDKVASITGGSSGIGLATAKVFSEEGAYLYITGRRRQPLEIASGKLAPHVTAMQGDVVNTADLDRCFEEIRRQHGHLDVIFANAGAAKFVLWRELMTPILTVSFKPMSRAYFLAFRRHFL